ncbi:uncharacterized protein SOCE26_078710 [Sorangium cellulosum]|uniref:Uncharacterized protein n=1 Tax=Sorangium cellulosum TaxID=56 RepID=A0A2L0F468_SORCE|nr:uncharacterized protein SOCE26_078710 [Sorangium cellulosum]
MSGSCLNLRSGAEAHGARAASAPACRSRFATRFPTAPRDVRSSAMASPCSNAARGSSPAHAAALASRHRPAACRHHFPDASGALRHATAACGRSQVSLRALASGKAPAASRRERRARRSAQACSPLRCHRQPEQLTDRLVHDPGRHVIPEGDGSAQGGGERRNHGGSRRWIDRREFSGPRARRLGRGWVHPSRGRAIRRHAPLKSRRKRRSATVRPRSGILAGFLTRGTSGGGRHPRQPERA